MSEKRPFVAVIVLDPNAMLGSEGLALHYMAIYKELHVLKFLPSPVLYLRRFINDGFGIWLHDPDPAITERN